ncbi:hypothetical protein [Sorangium sp. So ce204]|uniref:hypothetical protein n=1 Tax=Sorangium sp. So ce204 TaxID=3133288 RepID=UPI003F5E062A
MRTPRTSLVAAAFLAACGAPAGGAPSADAPSASAPSASAAASGSSSPTAASPPAPQAPAAASPAPAPCGALGCLAFDTPAQAFARVLESGPRVLAVGEAHAQRGSEGVPSTTRRFTELFLPTLAGRASDLIIELWAVDPRCKKEQVARVEAEQRTVTQGQAAQNQDEFLALGHAAKRLGIRPHQLTPSCQEIDAIVRAEPDAVTAMLEMIARLTAADAKALLGREDAAGKMVIAYGGALHNDVAPRPGRERWSFGPELSAITAGKYVELDLIVREFIKESESWRALPWYPHFDREKHPDKAVLFNPAPGSYTLIFPRSS